MRSRDRLNVWAMQFDVAEVGIFSGSDDGAVVAIEGVVQDGGAHREHQMGASRRPAHLLLGVHPPVEKALDCAFARALETGFAARQAAP
jgi:hypothetical protein